MAISKEQRTKKLYSEKNVAAQLWYVFKDPFSRVHKGGGGLEVEMPREQWQHQ